MRNAIAGHLQLSGALQRPTGTPDQIGEALQVPLLLSIHSAVRIIARGSINEQGFPGFLEILFYLYFFENYLCTMPAKPMKNSTQRHELILKILQENGRVMIDELSKTTGVSGVTIRKDLKLLEDKNLLFRTRGGASINNPYIIERTINEKELLHSREKQQIARMAVSLIGDNDSIIIGSGTTAFTLAQALHPSRPLTVITSAVKVTLELSHRPNIEVLQLGGLIRPNSSSVAGMDAERTLADISCGMFFMGVDGIDLEFGFSITNLQEATLDKAMIESAQKVVVLADSTKIGRRGLGKVCNFDEVHYLVTDSGISSKTVRQLEEKGLRVLIASEQSGH